MIFNSLTIELRLIVKEAKAYFLSRGGKTSIRHYDAKFGALGLTMGEQFVGGARVSITPQDGGYCYQVDNTTNRTSLYLHMPVDNPKRIWGERIPMSTTYQRYIWFEKECKLF